MLTTRCPHCSTVFRVRPEQLSARGGRVRCGSCQQAFSALAYLEEVDDDEILPPPAPRPVAPPSPPPAPPPLPVTPPVATPPVRSMPPPPPPPAPPAPPVVTAPKPAPFVPAAPVPAPIPPAPVVPAPPPTPVVPPPPPAKTPELFSASLLPPRQPASVAPPPGPAAVLPPEPAAPALTPAPEDVLEPFSATALPPLRQPAPVTAPPPPPRPARPSANIAEGVSKAPQPMHSPWGALDANPDTPLPRIEFPPVEQSEPGQPGASGFAQDAVLETEAPAFISMPAEPSIFPGGIEAAAEAPAVGDEFTMNIELNASSVPAGTLPDEDMDFDFSALDAGKPHQSEVGRSLGVKPYEPSRELDMGQTVMLEEPIELMGLPGDAGAPDSLFVERERQISREHIEDRRVVRHSYIWRWIAGVGLLAVLTLLQLTYVFRVDVARSLPQLRPHLETACELLGCAVPYPQEAQNISLEGSSFNPESGSDGKYLLVATILNRAAYPQAWPHLELTVTDRFDIAVTRRILAPKEWLPAPYTAQPAFDGQTEVTASLSLVLGDVPAAGYRLYAFYP